MSRSLREVIAEFDPDAFGTARWEDIPTPATPSWITDEWTTDNAPWYDPTGGGPARKHNPADSQELDPDETFKNKTYTENRVGSRAQREQVRGRTARLSPRRAAINSPLDAVMLIEGDESATHEQELEAWAYLIRSGDVWKLQGFYGRGATDLINSGQISRDGQILSHGSRKRADASNPFAQDGPGMGAGSGGSTAPGDSSYTPMGQTPQAAPAMSNTDPAAAGTAADTSGAMPNGDMPNQQQNIQPGTSMVPDASMATAKKIEDLFSRPSLSHVDKIAASVLATNPGLGLERAVQIARDTIARYPAVTRK